MATWFGYGIKDSIVVDSDDYDDDYDDHYDGDHGDRERAQIASLRLHVTHMPTAYATRATARSGRRAQRRGTRGC